MSECTHTRAESSHVATRRRYVRFAIFIFCLHSKCLQPKTRSIAVHLDPTISWILTGLFLWWFLFLVYPLPPQSRHGMSSLPWHQNNYQVLKFVDVEGWKKTTTMESFADWSWNFVPVQRHASLDHLSQFSTSHSDMCDIVIDLHRLCYSRESLVTSWITT